MWLEFHMAGTMGQIHFAPGHGRDGNCRETVIISSARFPKLKLILSICWHSERQCVNIMGSFLGIKSGRGGEAKVQLGACVRQRG